MGSEPWVRSNPPIFFHRDTNGVKDVMFSMRWCDGCHMFHDIVVRVGMTECDNCGVEVVFLWKHNTKNYCLSCKAKWDQGIDIGASGRW